MINSGVNLATEDDGPRRRNFIWNVEDVLNQTHTEYRVNKKIEYRSIFYYYYRKKKCRSCREGDRNYESFHL